MTDWPLVSAIIPAFNAEDTLGRAIDSVLNQTYPNIESIVVNDGSTDSTEAVATAYAGVRYFHQENKGLARTRNVGVGHALGEYIAFLDADDEWVTNKIERQMHIFLQDNRVDLLGTHRVRVKVDEHWNVLSRQPSPRADGRLVEVSFKQLIRGNRICGSSVVVRRSDFDEMGGFDSSLLAVEDHDLWLRMAAADKRLFNLNEPLYVFYERPGSLRKDLDKVVKAHRDIICKWNSLLNVDSPLSPTDFFEVKQWWVLKDAFRAFVQGEWPRGRALVRQAAAIPSRCYWQNAVVKLANLSPRLFTELGKLRGYPRWTG